MDKLDFIYNHFKGLLQEKTFQFCSLLNCWVHPRIPDYQESERWWKLSWSKETFTSLIANPHPSFIHNCMIFTIIEQNCNKNFACQILFKVVFQFAAAIEILTWQEICALVGHWAPMCGWFVGTSLLSSRFKQNVLPHLWSADQNACRNWIILITHLVSDIRSFARASESTPLSQVCSWDPY